MKEFEHLGLGEVKEARRKPGGQSRSMEFHRFPLSPAVSAVLRQLDVVECLWPVAQPCVSSAALPPMNDAGKRGRRAAAGADEDVDALAEEEEEEEVRGRGPGNGPGRPSKAAGKKRFAAFPDVSAEPRAKPVARKVCRPADLADGAAIPAEMQPEDGGGKAPHKKPAANVSSAASGGEGAEAKHRDFCPDLELPGPPLLATTVQDIINKSLSEQGKTFQVKAYAQKRKSGFFFELKCASCHYKTCAWKGFALAPPACETLSSYELIDKAHGQPRPRAKAGRKSRGSRPTFAVDRNHRIPWWHYAQSIHPGRGQTCPK